jgi:hypothetical protein
MKILVGILTFVAACACTSVPATSTTTVDVCANMARVGCVIGSDPRCAMAIAMAPSEHHTSYEAIACAGGAKSKAEVVACDPKFFQCN